jgi:hypothetical protein
MAKKKKTKKRPAPDVMIPPLDMPFDKAIKAVFSQKKKLKSK